MPKILEEIFIIYSEDNSDYIPFFNRSHGDSGRDIAAVKSALGEIRQNLEPTAEPPQDNSIIGDSWFSCADDMPISQEKMRLFD